MSLTEEKTECTVKSEENYVEASISIEKGMMTGAFAKKESGEGIYWYSFEGVDRTTVPTIRKIIKIWACLDEFNNFKAVYEALKDDKPVQKIFNSVKEEFSSKINF